MTRLYGGGTGLNKLLELCVLVMRRSACLREEGGDKGTRYRIVPDVDLQKRSGTGLEMADVLEHAAAVFMEASGRLRSDPSRLPVELDAVQVPLTLCQVSMRHDDLEAIRAFHHGERGPYSGRLRQAHRVLLAEDDGCTCSIDAYGERASGCVLSEKGCRYHDSAERDRRIREESSANRSSGGES